MLVEATLDFPDEDIDFLQEADAAGQLAALQSQLAAVQQRARQGALLREGIKVVIAGQPNAGKSSLLNALAGAELAIVSAVAGTTRDVVSQTIQIHGVPLHVVDTAGLRDSADEVEQIGIARAWSQIEAADAVLFLHDLTRARPPDYAQADADIAALLASQAARQRAGDRCLEQARRGCRPRSRRPSGVSLSARTGCRHRGPAPPPARSRRLAGGAGRRLPGAGAPCAGAVPGRGAHRPGDGPPGGPAQLLDLLAEELRLAQNALNEITGEFGADDLLGVIFSRFCIGK